MRTTPLADATRLHKALAHPVRLRLLAMLRGGELCVCQLNAVIALAPSTISAHLAELKGAGLLTERKSGRWVHYRLAAEDSAAAALAALWPTLDQDSQVAADAALLAELTRLPVVELSRPGFDLATLRARCCPAPSKAGETGTEPEGAGCERK